jgi:hypothetical protein
MPDATPKRGPGRPKGTPSPRKGVPNKPKMGIIAAIRREFPGYDPLLALVRLAHEPDTTTDQRISCHKEVAQYCVPKLKAIELTGAGGGPLKANVSVSFERPDPPSQFTPDLEPDAPEAPLGTRKVSIEY